ncbi:hypothetical protein [Butyrivibrio sp. FC2001]|uniref:hypothetical protein n=1 Tax=Butyrivibrio sp. FC2001 TaxID=1280671 RepID=UPI0004787797|nr:hypothetical protein [Butyrivibrio sp. FC2001]
MSSIDYDCLLTSEYYNEDTLDKAVENYFSCKLRVSERFGSTVYMEAQAGENLLFGIYLINYENEAVWDSDIIGRDYHYRQCVSIALDKEHADMGIVASVIDFFLKLQDKNKQEMLVKSHVHDDICHVMEGKITWKESFYRQYKELFTGIHMW